MEKRECTGDGFAQQVPLRRPIWAAGAGGPSVRQIHLLLENVREIETTNERGPVSERSVIDLSVELVQIWSILLLREHSLFA